MMTPLFISAVYHKAFVETTEERTEAAAATAASMLLLGRPPDPGLPIPIFRADHPFLFAIRECKSGAILFLGPLAHPRQDG